MTLEAVLTVRFFFPSEITGLTAFSFSLPQGLRTRLLDCLVPICTPTWCFNFKIPESWPCYHYLILPQMSESLIISFCLSIKGLPAIGYCSLSIQFSFQTCYWSCVPQGYWVHSLKHLAVKNFLLPCIYFIPLQFYLVSVLNNSSPYFCSSNIYSVLCSTPSSVTLSTF